MSTTCRPEPQSEVPVKRIVSTIESGRPAKDSKGLFRSEAHTAPLSLEGFNETVSALKSLASRRYLPRGQHKLTVMEHFLRLKRLMVTAVEKVRNAQSTIASARIYEMQRQQ